MDGDLLWNVALNGDLTELAKLIDAGHDPMKHGVEFATLLRVCLETNDRDSLERGMKRLELARHFADYPTALRAREFAESVGRVVGRSMRMDTDGEPLAWAFDVAREGGSGLVVGVRRDAPRLFVAAYNDEQDAFPTLILARDIATAKCDVGDLFDAREIDADVGLLPYQWRIEETTRFGIDDAVWIAPNTERLASTQTGREKLVRSFTRYQRFVSLGVSELEEEALALRAYRRLVEAGWDSDLDPLPADVGAWIQTLMH